MEKERIIIMDYREKEREEANSLMKQGLKIVYKPSLRATKKLQWTVENEKEKAI